MQHFNLTRPARLLALAVALTSVSATLLAGQPAPKQSSAADSSKLTLQQCIDIALNNADRRQTEALLIDIGKKRMQLARLPFGPTYSAIAQARTSFGDNLYDPAGGTLGQRFAIGLRSDYTLFDSGLRNYRLRIAELGAVDAKLSAQETVEGVIRDTASAFYDLSSEQRKYTVRELYLQAATAHLIDAQERMKLGLSAKPEVDMATSTVQSAKSDLALKVSHRTNAAMRLALAMGRSDTEALPEAAESPMDEGPQTLPASLPDDVVNRSPALMKANNAVKIATEQLKVVRSAYGPVISTYAALGFLDRPFPVDSGRNRSRPFFTIGIGIQLPLLDKRAKEIDEQIQKDDIKLKTLEAKQLERTIREASRETLSTFSAVVAQVQSLEAAEIAGDDALRLAEARYKNSVGTQSDVLIAMRDLAATRDLLADARDTRDRLLRIAHRRAGVTITQPTTNHQ